MEHASDGMVNVGPKRFSRNVLATEVQSQDQQEGDGVRQTAFYEMLECAGYDINSTTLTNLTLPYYLYFS